MDLVKVDEKLSNALRELKELQEATNKALRHIDEAHRLVNYLEDEENPEERSLMMTDLEDELDGLDHAMNQIP